MTCPTCQTYPMSWSDDLGELWCSVYGNHPQPDVEVEPSGDIRRPLHPAVLAIMEYENELHVRHLRAVTR